MSSTISGIRSLMSTPPIVKLKTINQVLLERQPMFDFFTFLFYFKMFSYYFSFSFVLFVSCDLDFAQVWGRISGLKQLNE